MTWHRVLKGVQRDGTGVRNARDSVRIEDRRQATTTATPPDDPSGTADSSGAAEALPLALRSVGLSLLALYALLLAWLTLRQVSTAWAYDANLTPFASVHRALGTGGAAGLRQVAGGLATLAPLGVLLPMAGGRLRTAWLPSFLQTLGATALIATALEVVRTGVAGQVLNVDDILLGVIGAALAHLAVVPAGRARLRARPTAEQPATTPTPAAAPAPTPSPSPAGAEPPAPTTTVTTAVTTARDRLDDTPAGRLHHLRTHRPGPLPVTRHHAPARAHRF
ncbi:VanZ family protein [Kitasatospora sp. GAS1066B]|uniref:VanZ family protein n=1 Tax=Kitasatospora sp. GAS1066B TaxID=3156271 RepID=UPI00247C36CD|nr:hypothetical protein [Kitasatospora sp. GAS204B]